MKLYLAGKMSGIPEFNFPAFNAEAARLRELGYEIVNPAELNADTNGDWQACMRADIRELVACDGIALLDNWHDSEGATLEHDIAFRLGLAIYRAKSLRNPIPCPGKAKEIDWRDARVGIAESFDNIHRVYGFRENAYGFRSAVTDMDVAERGVAPRKDCECTYMEMCVECARIGKRS